MSEPNNPYPPNPRAEEPGTYQNDTNSAPLPGDPNWQNRQPFKPSGQRSEPQRAPGQGQGNFYSPYPPYPERPRRQDTSDQWSPYQYNANSGWQQSANEPRYEWNYDDYESYHQSKKSRKHKGRGFLIFFVCLLGSISVGLVILTMLSFVDTPNTVPADQTVESAVLEETPEKTSDAPGVSLAIELASKPQISEALPVNGRMTIPQVADYVSPSVVSVVRYNENMIYSEATGIGSGIILSEDGYIVTNAHVIEDGSAFKIQLGDGTPYDASLIGFDTFTDLAVLKAEAVGLRPAQFGDSNELLVGETVVAIGNPVDLSFAGSVTKGIVSAVNREVNTSRYHVTYIQTDAAINPGNSGGALANEFGQVIGINTAKIFRAGYEGMGFSIPINEAKPIIDDLLMYGWVTGRVRLGIEGLPIDAVDAARGNLMEGVIIKSIDPESDLNNHNVLRDDIITHVNGTRIHTVEDIHAAIDEFSVGDEVELSIYRRVSPTSDTEFTVKSKLIESKG